MSALPNPLILLLFFPKLLSGMPFPVTCLSFLVSTQTLQCLQRESFTNREKPFILSPPTSSSRGKHILLCNHFNCFLSAKGRPRPDWLAQMAEKRMQSIARQSLKLKGKYLVRASKSHRGLECEPD